MLGERALEKPGSADRATAFEALAQQNLDSSYRLAALILRDPVEAQDAVHDAFVKAWRSWSSLRDVSRFDAWFGRILVNVCRDRLRSGRRWSVVDISAALGHRDSHDHAGGVDDRMAIERAFKSLNADQRIAIVLRFYLDMSVDDIALRVGVPAGTVKSRLHNALKQVGSDLQLAVDEEGDS
jgi:RNA polymerase sigma-70 factor (ECF subfamily)